MSVSIGIPIDQNQVLKIMCFDESVDFGGWEQTPQFHNNCEIGFFIDGNISVVIENNLFFLQNGDILLIAPDEMHMGKILKRGNFEYFQFDIPKELVHFMQGECHLLNCFFNKRIGEKNLIHASTSTLKMIFDNLYKIKDFIRSDTVDKKALCLSCFIQIMSLVNDSFRNPTDTIHETKKVPVLMEQLITTINSEYKELFSLNDIAKKANISKSYLMKLFKEYIGFSPYQFLISKKISCAKILLRNGANVTEACFESGFNDYSYFISLFRKVEGQTPLKYKNQTKL